MSADVVEARKWALGVLWGVRFNGKALELFDVLPLAEALAQWALTGESPPPASDPLSPEIP